MYKVMLKKAKEEQKIEYERKVKKKKLHELLLIYIDSRQQNCWNLNLDPFYG